MSIPNHLFNLIVIILFCGINYEGGPGSVVGIATGYGLDDRGVGVRVPVGVRIFISACRPDRLGSTQPPIQRVSEALSQGVKRPGREAVHSPRTSAEVKKNVDLYIHFLIRLHGVVLN
jgi:hypothetical protein